VGDWPVVQVQSGKARIVGFESIPDWLARHSELLHREMMALGQLWTQRVGKHSAGPELGARIIAD
jgi:branched-chain amino acid transport system substrate-binding protein